MANTDNSGTKALPVIDITIKTPLNPTSSSNSTALGLQEEVALEQSFWIWKPRSFRISTIPIIIGVVYIVMPVICYIVGSDYKDQIGFKYLVIFSGAPLPFLIFLGIISVINSCSKPSYGVLKEIVIILLAIVVVGINVSGLCYFDHQLVELPILRIFPIMVAIFTSIIAIIVPFVFFAYRSIVKRVILSNKLEQFIEKFEKQGKIEDCSFYCSKNGCF